MTQKKVALSSYQIQDALEPRLAKKLKIPQGSINKIMYLIDRDNYALIFETYGLRVIHELATYFLEEEDYGTLSVIRDVIKDYNYIHGTSFSELKKEGE